MNKSWLLPAIGVFALALIVFFGSGTVSQPVNHGPITSFVSIEKSVASFSPSGVSGGVSIPASCESGYEHYPGECAGSPPSGCRTCTTAANACGMTNTGFTCDNGSTCSASIPSDSLCSSSPSSPPPSGGDCGGHSCSTAWISANPTTIYKGEPSTLTWGSTNSNMCYVTALGWRGPSGSEVIHPESTADYTATCMISQEDHWPYQSPPVRITVLNRLPTVDLQGPSVVELPDPINLTWFTQYADSCLASGGWSGNKATPNGSESIPKPRGTYTFNLSCTGSGGSGSDSQTVRVVQLPRCSFTANPLSIIPPATSTLSWSCLYADNCTIDHGIGSVNNISGSIDVRPPVTTIYSLNCSGLDGSRSWPATVGVGFIPKLKEILPR